MRPDLRALFFGDSFVAGVGDPQGLGWVGRVVAAAHTADLPLTTYNLGVRGQTSLQVAERWRRETEPRLSPEADCRLIVSFGANDVVVEDGTRRVSQERSCGALEQILEGAAELKLPVFCVGPPPLGESELDSQLALLAELFRAICERRSFPFVDVTETLARSDVWRQEALANDGTHPSENGYAALAEAVLSGGLLSWLGRPAAVDG